MRRNVGDRFEPSPTMPVDFLGDWDSERQFLGTKASLSPGKRSALREHHHILGEMDPCCTARTLVGGITGPVGHFETRRKGAPPIQISVASAYAARAQ